MTQRRSGLGVSPRVFAVTVAGAFVVALDLSIVNIAFPSIRRSFPGTTEATLSWVLSAYSVVFGALLLASGRMADRTGRRRAFFRGLGVFTLGSVICSAAPGAAFLVGGRVVQAVGAALLAPASLALLLSVCEPARRAAMVATWGGVSALAVATGPSVGAVLVQEGGWRLAFIVNIPVAATAWLIGRRVLPESAAGGHRPDLVGVGLVTAGVAALALAVTQGDDWGWTSPGVIGSLAAAVLLLPASVFRSVGRPAAALDIDMLRARPVALANAATLAYAAAFFAMLLGNVLFLTSVWHYSTLRAGLAITPGPLLVAFLSPRTGRLAARIGFRPVLTAGALTFAAGVAAYAVIVSSHARYLAEWLPVSLVVGVGVALTFPVLSAAAVAGLPSDRFAVGSATNQTARQVGAVVGVAMLVAVLGHAGGPALLNHFREVWWLCAGAAVVSALLSAFQPRIVPAPAAQPRVLPDVEPALLTPRGRDVALVPVKAVG